MNKYVIDNTIKALKNDTLYDYVSNNYYTMSTEELATIIKELEYAIYSLLSNSDNKAIKRQVIEELQAIKEDL